MQNFLLTQLPHTFYLTHFQRIENLSNFHIQCYNVAERLQLPYVVQFIQLLYLSRIEVVKNCGFYFSHEENFVIRFACIWKSHKTISYMSWHRIYWHLQDVNWQKRDCFFSMAKTFFSHRMCCQWVTGTSRHSHFLYVHDCQNGLSKNAMKNEEHRKVLSEFRIYQRYHE